MDRVVVFFAVIVYAAIAAAKPPGDIPEGMMALPSRPPVPAENPQTPAKIALGKQLYFETKLSVTGTVSCNHCHNVMAGGTDNQALSLGFAGQKGNRSSPTVWNAAYLSVQFWDGRAASLEEQAKGPLINPAEMGFLGHNLVMKRILAIPGYVGEFKQAFGDGPYTIENAVKAIAAYERTLITPNSAFDQYVRGHKKALSPEAHRGMLLVKSVGCTTCHFGPNFAGPSLAEGSGFYRKFPVFPGSGYEKEYKLTDDLGRYGITHQDADKKAWRVPTWRNIALAAPYFHNGLVPTLDLAVRVMAKMQLNQELKEAEVRDIVAFLDSLTGEFPKQEMPRLPEVWNKTGLE